MLINRMRIIARNKLTSFVASLAGQKDQKAVKTATDSWFAEVKRSAWSSSADVKARYATASIVTASRVVFNIKGNDYRLVVEIDYSKAIVWTIWIGSHKDYDRIDVRKVRHDQ